MNVYVLRYRNDKTIIDIYDNMEAAQQHMDLLNKGYQHLNSDNKPVFVGRYDVQSKCELV